ncbi:hypothetical protein [Finegoldia magna]|uniref:hypothetical protein n=1 Tax=Finegoldia magna TaxID=1260 RepID=UPI000B91CA82|nr:hypothetical protein [Finegoldia magna]OXZ38077.1 hypothetical protein B9N50_07945 [Finegoldia magna]
MNDLIKLNLKLLKNKTYLLSSLFGILLPLTIMLSIGMYFEMIIPMIAIIHFSIINDIEHKNKVEIPVYMTGQTLANMYIIRIVIDILFYIVLSVLFYFYFKYIVRSSYQDPFAISDSVGMVVIILISIINYIYFGSISLFLTSFFKNNVFPIIISFGYLIFWMSNYINFEILFNPFSFSAGMLHYKLCKLIQLIISCILLYLYIRKKKNKII